MTVARSTIALTVGLVAASVVLSACSSAPAPVTTTAPPQDTPLGRYLYAFSNVDASDADRAAQKTEVENEIASCMAAQGFDYTPEPYNPMLEGGRPGDWRPDDEDWVSQWGYGAISFPAAAEAVQTDGMDPTNMAYYNGLSAAEQAAFSDTMWGPAPTQEQIAANIAQSAGRTTWQQEGCWGQARHDVIGDGLDDPQFQPLAQAVAAFQSTEFQAPDFDQLNADWSACMASAGHPGLSRQADAEASIDTAATELRTSSDTVIPVDDPRMLDLQRQEIDLALADLDCRTKVDYRARAQTIQYALEDRFVADHQAELDEFLATAEQGG